jgi:BolA protein
MSRKVRMQARLQELAPIFFQVEDESAHHHVPEAAESHFKVIVVSNKFSGLKQILRHRMVNKLLEFEKEFALGLHALSLHLYTPEEWEASGKSILKSPPCKDGFLK